MTAGRLYEILLADWLQHEVSRQTARGAAEPLSTEQRAEALRELALLLWRTGRSSVPLAELGKLAEGVADLAAWQVQAGEAAHAVGSGTVLVRTERDEFAFIHQSVMEWYFADTIRLALTGASSVSADTLLADYPLTRLMADFLKDLAGEHAAEWAMSMVSGAANELGPRAKSNAVLILGGSDSTAPVNYSGQDLRGQDLSKQNLNRSDLSGADLSGAVLPRRLAWSNLSGARLVSARLDAADLRDADLSGADLRGARLIAADLSGADLSGTRLDRAVLLDANVEGADFTNASTFGTAMPSSKLVPQFAGRSLVAAVIAIHDGELIATGHEDGTIRIWDFEAGLPIRTLHGHIGPVHALAESAQQGLLISAGDDKTVRLWDDAGVEVATFRGHEDRVRALAVGPDGGWLASASDDKTVRIWDFSGQCVRTLQGYDPVTVLAAGADGCQLAFGDAKTVRVADPRTGASLCTLTGHPHLVTGLAISPDGRWIATMTGGKVWVWDAHTAIHLRTFEEHTSNVRSIAFTPDGRWLATADFEKVRIWDPISGQRLRGFAVAGAAAGAMTFGPDGSWLAVADGSTARIYDVATGADQRRLHIGPGATRMLAASPDGSWLVSAAEDGQISTWDLRAVTENETVIWAHGSVGAVAASPDGRWCAATGMDGVAYVWKPRSNDYREIGRSAKHSRAMAFSPDGDWLRYIADNGMLISRHVTSDDAYHITDGDFSMASAMVVSAVGTWLAIATHAAVKIISLVSGTVTHTLAGHLEVVRAIVEIPSTGWLASAGDDGSIHIWDVKSGARIRIIRGSTEVYALAAHPSGAWLASAGRDAVIELWNTASGERLRTLVGYGGSVTDLAVGPNGAWLASTSRDGTVRLWDPDTGAQLLTLVSDGAGASAVLFPDGGYQMNGTPEGLWWAAGLCRFEPAEIDEIAAHAQGIHRKTPGRST
jgi:WD40 repeat protein